VLFGGKRKQFEELVLGEIGSLFRLAYRLTSNQAAAEDLVQETLLRAFRSFSETTLREFGIKPWLLKILHNVYFNERLAQKRHHVLKDEPVWEQMADHHSEPWDQTDIDHVNWEDFDEEIKSGIDTLAPEYRIVLLLWSLEQLSYREIADICNIPVGTVMSRLYRARKDLSARLAEYAVSHRLVKNPLPGPTTPKSQDSVSVSEGSQNGL